MHLHQTFILHSGTHEKQLYQILSETVLQQLTKLQLLEKTKIRKSFKKKIINNKSEQFKTLFLLMHPNESCVHCPLMQCAVFIDWFAV